MLEKIEITFKSGDIAKMDEDGRWTIECPDCPILNGRILQDDVIEKLQRDGDKETLKKYFPMLGFHS